jgi:hypothetical protein
VTTIRAAVIILFLVVHSNDLLADQAIPSQTTGEAGGQLQKGTVETSIIGGVTLPTTLFRARRERRLVMGSLQIGRVLTPTFGHGPLGGNFEMLVEMTPLMLVWQPDRAFGLAVSPLHLRWNFLPLPSGRVRVFGEVSGGILYTSRAVPARTTTFNFIDQAGFGLRFEHRPRRAILLGYRFQHISNGGRVKPNPGANFNFVYAGMSFLR